MERLKRKRVHFRRHPLDNGLILLVSENHRLPLISINAFVLAGLDQNPLDRPGIAALTSRLVTEGTRNYGAHEIYEIVENTGGNLTTFCERELSGISLVTPSQDLGLGLDLLQEILAGPTFPEVRFQLEKRKVLSQLQAMGDEPQTVAAHRLRHWIYQGSPLQYPVLGVQKSVSDKRPPLSMNVSWRRSRSRFSWVIWALPGIIPTITLFKSWTSSWGVVPVLRVGFPGSFVMNKVSPTALTAA